VAIAGFDHVAIPTARPLELIAFYGALGFAVPDPEEIARLAFPAFEIRFGKQKINVHLPGLWQNERFTLRGPSATPGCADLCFVWDGSAEELRRTLERAGAEIIAGPMPMSGARGRGISVYTRDPERNLVEFIRYDDVPVRDEPAD
jgi:catechol 2,3-dioxygenase-like lactoylglutathione lyase family enzyme